MFFIYYSVWNKSQTCYLFELLDTLNNSVNAGRVQWSRVEHSAAPHCELPAGFTTYLIILDLTYNTQRGGLLGWQVTTSLGSQFSLKYETLLYYLLPHPGHSKGRQVGKVGDVVGDVSSDPDLRAPVSPDEVHFKDDSPTGLPRNGKQGQSVLNCLMGCTRELRVRKHSILTDIMVNGRHWYLMHCVMCIVQEVVSSWTLFSCYKLR